MFLGTWNVNGKQPKESLDKWLHSSPHPDLYAIGFQELDLSGTNLFLGTSPLEAQWESHISKCLNSQGTKYLQLLSKRLVGVFLLIFCKLEHQFSIKDIQADESAVGIMGMMGNKGGVAIRFNYNDSSICVVNSHLNAHQENTVRRNQDFHDISRRINFTLHNKNHSMFDHDFLFWMGDLNYRIDMTEEDVKKKIAQKDWRSLLSNDQLTREQKKGNCFEDFLEGEIDFAPTYKYNPGTEDYESEKGRIPAWCDRVLWKATRLTQISYRRHELVTSDHKPVSALCQILVKTILHEARQEVYQDLVNQLDKMDNEARATIAIDRDTVQFPDMKYLVPVTKAITIENTGGVVARFRFRPKMGEEKFCPDWIWISPAAGILVPGEKKRIKITVQIDDRTAPIFNFQKQKLEEILLLHLSGGTDVFVTVSGSYIPSCFGSTLTHLVRVPGPIAQNQVLPPSSPDCLAVPKELWRMVDYLYKNGLEVENLFLETGVQSEMQILRDCLDTGESFSKHQFDIHSMAETLLKWFESLSSPVIPFELQSELSECQKFVHCKQLTASLNSVHFSVFYYIIGFLREVLGKPPIQILSPNQNVEPKLPAVERSERASKLAIVFSSVLVRPRDSLNPRRHTSEAFDEGQKERARFLEFFFDAEDDEIRF